MFNFIRRWFRKPLPQPAPSKDAARAKLAAKAVAFVWQHHAKPLDHEPMAALAAIIQEAEIIGGWPRLYCHPYSAMPPLDIPYRSNYADGYLDGRSQLWCLRPDARPVLMADDRWMLAMAGIMGLDGRQAADWLEMVHAGPGCDPRAVEEACRCVGAGVG